MVEGELNLALAGTASYGLFNFAGTGNRYSHHRPDRIQHAPAEALYSAKTAGRNRVVAAQAASAAVFNSIKAPAASPSTA